MDDPDENCVVLIMEFVPGGCVLVEQSEHRVQPFDEEVAAHLFRHLVSGLLYLHHHHIIHRDIKPSNLLVQRYSTGEGVTMQDVLKIADFGVSGFFHDDDDKVISGCGTPAFFPPEAFLDEEYSGKAADVWAAGVTLYIFLFGRLPFSSTRMSELCQEITDREITWPSDISISDQCRNCILRALEKDPEKRATIDELFEHPWVSSEENRPKAMGDHHREEISITEDELHSAITPVQITFKTVMSLHSWKMKSTRKLKQRGVAAQKNLSLLKNAVRVGFQKANRGTEVSKEEDFNDEEETMDKQEECRKNVSVANSEISDEGLDCSPKTDSVIIADVEDVSVDIDQAD